MDEVVYLDKRVENFILFILDIEIMATFLKEISIDRELHFRPVPYNRWSEVVDRDQMAVSGKVYVIRKKGLVKGVVREVNLQDLIAEGMEIGPVNGVVIATVCDIIKVIRLVEVDLFKELHILWVRVSVKVRQARVI